MFSLKIISILIFTLFPKIVVLILQLISFLNFYSVSKNNFPFYLFCFSKESLLFQFSLCRVKFRHIHILHSTCIIRTGSDGVKLKLTNSFQNYAVNATTVN